MDEKKKVNITVVILNCICAVVWNLNLIIALVEGCTLSVSLVLRIFCAIAWDACAVTWIIRYRKSKEE